MGDLERETTMAFAEQDYPEIEGHLQRAAGFSVPVEVRWDELTLDQHASMLVDGFQRTYFVPLFEAFEALTNDDTKKAQLQGALTRVVVRNSQGQVGPDGITMEDGVLTVDHHPLNGVNDVADRRRAIIDKVLAVYRAP